jgi:glucose/arabinose dehydrogenase
MTLSLVRFCRRPAHAVAAILLMGGAADIAGAQAFESEHHALTLTTVAEGLEHPWSIAFLPDGDMLVTERPGRLRIVRDGALLPNAVTGLPSARVGGQGGYQEVAVHPDFANNRLIYLSYAKPNADGSQSTTAIVRGRLENDRVSAVEEVFEAQAWSEGRGHYGAKLAFHPEGYLFFSVGDRQVPPEGDLESHPAQDPSNHFGTINRIHDDGRIPDDNPFVGRSGVQPSIWSFGHRNPQGLVIDQDTGNVWATEHGPQGGDELNLILAGRNYGWPVIGYGVNYRTGLPIHSSTHKDGMAQPVAFWVPSIGASGLLLYDGDAFPMWRGNLLAGGLSAQHRRLSRLSLDGRRVMTREPLLLGAYRIRDVRQGPDGLIYLAVDDREGGLTAILRLDPVT